MMIPAHSQYTINLGLFEQNGGWVFLAVPAGTTFDGPVLFSGKRRSLSGAIEAAKKLAGDDVSMLYSRLDNVNDWTY
jgi:hypothetical protein